MNIVICDDDEMFARTFDSKIRQYLESINIICNIAHYISGEDLLQSNIHQVDIIFLDIGLAKMNGIEVAVSLRRRKPNFILIFVSGMLEYAPTGYEVKAFRYILKDQLDLLFAGTMEAALKELGFFREKMTFDFIYGSADIFTDEIVYLESRLHAVHFHIINNAKTLHLYETLNAIEKILPEDEFIRIHQSFLVNLRYFIDARNYQAFLINKIVLPISQKKFPDVKKRLFIYRGKM